MQGEQDMCSYLKSNFQHRNRDQYLQLIRQTITKEQQKPSQQIQPTLQEYAQQYRNFMHNFNFTSNNKANTLIQDALNTVHPGLKTKKQCKVILSIVAKIFCQELIQECVEVKEEYSAKREQSQEHLGNNNVSSNKSNGSGVINSNNQTQQQLNHKKGEKKVAQIDIDVVEEAYRRRAIKREKI